jgi:Uma2 family endonuclease
MNIEILQSPSRAGRMTAAQFRAFQDHRPDHERWELIAGVPIMMAPPTIVHNRIASNLERLLNDALIAQDSARLAAQRPGVTLAAAGDYRPEPDVGVIDSDFQAGQRFVDRAYLLAEVVSETDELRDPDSGRRWIEVKRDIYFAHAACEAVLTIEQDRIEVRVDVRTKAGWSSRVVGPGDNLLLSGFGLSCAIADLYEGTPLNPRPMRDRRPA